MPFMGLPDAPNSRYGPLMWKLLHPAYDLYRRWLGTFTLDDPRPIKASAPYTYYLPSEARLAGIAPGDDVKVIIRSQPAGLKYDAERMWVRVVQVSSAGIDGELNNDPFDMPQLKPGHPIRLQPFHVIDILADRELADEPEQPQYWDRCMVDRCVVDEGVPVYYIYREEPDMAQPGDKYPDSGWHIRGDYRNVSDEALAARKAYYIALGKVLNADDSWLHLIDSPIGSSFMRNFETGDYEPCERAPDDDD